MIQFIVNCLKLPKGEKEHFKKHNSIGPSRGAKEIFNNGMKNIKFLLLLLFSLPSSCSYLI